MTRITSGLLNDTLNLVQLARETALQQGKQDQAKRLSPVVNEMRNLVNTTHQAPAAKPTGMLAQDDFRSLLAASQANTTRTTSTPVQTASGVSSQAPARTISPVGSTPATTAASAYSPAQSVSGLERNRIVVAMAAGSMSDVDIARQMGMTRDEVRLILNVNQRSRTSTEG